MLDIPSFFIYKQFACSTNVMSCLFEVACEKVKSISIGALVLAVLMPFSTLSPVVLNELTRTKSRASYWFDIRFVPYSGVAIYGFVSPNCVMVL